MEMWEQKQKRSMRWHSWLLANLSTLIANMVPRKKTVRFDVADFMPGEQRAIPQQTSHQMHVMAQVLSTAGWGQMIDKTDLN